MRFNGISGFAAPNTRFPTSRFLQQYPPDVINPAIAVLPGTFGWSHKTLKAFCDRFADRPHLVEVHISNGPGRRNKMYKGDFAREFSVSEFNRALVSNSPRIVRRINQRCKRVKRWLARCTNEQTKIVICPELEDNLLNEAWTNLAKQISKTLPYRMVRNPVSGGKGGFYTEEHGKTALARTRRMLANLDGCSIDFKDGEVYKATSIGVKAATNWYKSQRLGFARFLWSANQQGLNGAGWGAAGAPPPKERDFVVTDEAMVGMRKILEGY